MLITLSILKLVIPFTNNRLLSFITVAIYSIVGIITYYLCIKKFNLIDAILGNELLEKFKKKIKRKVK